MPRAPKPRGGRPMGSLNKATIEKQIQAAREIDRARETGEELAKDVLNRLMKLAEGAAAKHRPQTTASGEVVEGTGDWALFGAWFDRTAFVAKELAKYQSPTYRAIAVSMPPPLPALTESKTIEGKVVDMPMDAMSGSRLYQRMVNGR